MGSAHSSPAQQCLLSAVGGSNSLVAFPSKLLYQFTDVKPYNLDYDVTPKAVTYPQTVEMVSKIVQCAGKYNLKVQARSGGHSYGNYAIGGQDGSVVVDLKNFKQFSMDNSTWHATIGAGHLLGDVTQLLHNAGGRAIAHGTCPQVGIGGHATVGGMGPTSRLWGLTLDHVLEVQVVLANGTVTTASASQNEDLFFALRGAGASFGIITQFKFRTEPEPGETVQYSFTFDFGSASSKAQLFKAWQKLAADPSTPRELASQVIVSPFGMTLYGTYFGSKDDFDALNMAANFPTASNGSVQVLDDWLGQVAQWANVEAEAGAGGIPSHFYAKALVFTNDTLIPDDGIDNLFDYFDNTDAGTPLWFAIFALAGGSVSDVPEDETAFSIRADLYDLQTYAINLIGDVSDTTKSFLAGVNKVLTDAVPEAANNGAYPGYVDPALKNGQQVYWGSNLPRLESIKAKFDPADIFHNPQSVRPAKS